MKFFRLVLVIAITLVPRHAFADAEIWPSAIDVPDSEIVDLQSRLSQVRWRHQLPGTKWEHGADKATLKMIAEYWPGAEVELNSFRQFLTEVDGAKLHFVHSRSEAEEAVPLILLRGRPGSFFEFSDLIEPLNQAAGDAPAFHPCQVLGSRAQLLKLTGTRGAWLQASSN